jgi:hypothetical protein
MGWVVLLVQFECQGKTAPNRPYWTLLVDLVRKFGWFEGIATIGV